MTDEQRSSGAGGRGRDGERGAGTLEYVGIVVVAAILVAAVVTAVVRADLGRTLACELRSVGTQAGTCGGPDVPTTYGPGEDGAAAPDGGGGGPATPVANEDGYEGAAPPEAVDQDKVDAALDDLRDALDGGFLGVREGDLDDAQDALEGLNGAEIDAVIAAMSDEELEEWVDQLDDGWLTGGWDRERRRELWNLLASRASQKTLDRLAGITPELQPDFRDVGGDGARDDPDSPANVGTTGELPHELVIDGAHPLDVRQGSIGDCWWIASMMAVAQANPELIERAITANPNGTYTVRLYDDGSPVDVVVTPEMVLWPDGSPAFVDNQVRGGKDYELWPLVLEKALALRYGDYEDIEGGHASEGLEMLTGRESRTYDPDDISAADMRSVLDDGGAVAVSSMAKDKGKGKPLYAEDAGARRLFEGHAYYVQSVDLDKGTVTVVNPWGINDWPPVTLTVAEFEENFREVQTNEVGS